MYYNNMAKKEQNITAIIYDKKGRVLSVGKNSYIKTHPKQAKLAQKAGLPMKEFLHAEVASIIRCKDLSKAYRIVVYRNNKAGFANAEPCPICKLAIKEAGIKQVEWTK
jgi:deoxycytidylate deaminase